MLTFKLKLRLLTLIVYLMCLISSFTVRVCLTCMYNVYVTYYVSVNNELYVSSYARIRLYVFPCMLTRFHFPQRVPYARRLIVLSRSIVPRRLTFKTLMIYYKIIFCSTDGRSNRINANSSDFASSTNN